MKGILSSLLHKFQTVATVVSAAVMRAAAGETGRCFAQNPRPRKVAAAVSAAVKKATRATMHRKRERVTTRFVRDPKIGAGLAPFRAMRRDPSPARPEVREQVRQLMAQRPLHFVRTNLDETRIERNPKRARIRAPRRTR